MTLHIFGPAFSTLARSVRLYCEEKGLAYTHGLILDGEQVQLRSPEHLRLHPFGKVPVLLDGEARVFETTSICRYLDAAYPDTSLQPTEPLSRAEVDQWSGALALYIDQVLVRRYLLLVASPVPTATPDPSAVADAADAVAKMFSGWSIRSKGASFFAEQATAWPIRFSHPCWTTCSGCLPALRGSKKTRSSLTICGACATVPRPARFWHHRCGCSRGHFNRLA